MKLIRNFLDDTVLQQCKLDLEDKIKKDIWYSNRNVWGAHLVLGLKGDVLGTAVDPSINNNIKEALTKHVPELCDVDTEVRSQYFQWKPSAGISMHSDHLFKFVATLYLNREWEVDYGGIFLWQDLDNELRAQCPEYNAIMIDTDTLNHCVTPVTYAAPENRLTIQILGIIKQK